MSRTGSELALIGVSLRLPGADSLRGFWQTIRSGACHIRTFTPRELMRAGVPSEHAEAEDFVGATASVEGIDRFDAAFFSMSGKEAELTDPQHRLFLECAHHALEDAGYAGAQRGLRTAVFASTGFHLYGLRNYPVQQLLNGPLAPDWLTGMHRVVASYPDFTASRAAFRLGLTGPAVGVQSACSSSLVAVHMARQALLTGDADVALVGAAAVHVPQVLGYHHLKGSILSRTGRCLPFSSESDGTVGGNGAVAVVLKRLDRALADGDTVHAVLRGSAINNDGWAKRHYSEPSAQGQRAVLRDALRASGTTAAAIGYVETHGTGTYKGDPIEFAALSQVHREQGTGREGHCALGAVKANIGHLDAASGLAGLLKAALVVKHGTIPPLAGLVDPNPLLSLEDSPFILPTKALRWEPDGPRLAGVSSLGVGGTNAHAVLEEPPARRSVALPVPRALTREDAGRTHRPESTGGRTRGSVGVTANSASSLAPDTASVLVPGLVPLSGRDQVALVAGARALRRHLALFAEITPADLVTTLGLGRRHERHRLALVGSDRASLTSALDDFLAGHTEPHEHEHQPERGSGWRYGLVSPGAERPPLVWVFSGQGGARRGMARQLYERFEPVRDVLDACEELYRQEYGSSLLEPLLDQGRQRGRPLGTGLGQPALFALQAAQARLWRTVVSPPELVAGHSVGEFAALHTAGVLSLAQGLRLTTERGRLMERECGPGAMLAVFADHDTVEALLAEQPRLCRAVVNGSRHQVLAGPPESVANAERQLTERGVRSRRLAVDRAFHSPLMEPVLPALRALTQQVAWAPARIPYLDGATGARVEVGGRPDADWLARHARESVRYDQVMRQLAALGPKLVQEIGPDAVLSGLAAREHTAPPTAPSQRPGNGAPALWDALGAHWCQGQTVDWPELTKNSGGRRVPLPGYAFQRRRYWSGPALVEPDPRHVRAGTKKVATSDEAGGENMRDLEPILAHVRERTAEHLGAGVEDCGPQTPFFDLGADSLQMINMLQELEHSYGVKVGMRELFEEADTPLLLAQLIAERGGRAQEASQAAPARPAATPPTPAPSAPAPAPVVPVQTVPAPPSPPLAPAAGKPEPTAGVSLADASAPTEPVKRAEPGEGRYATHAQVAELSERIEQMARHQAQLMRQLTLLLDSQLQTPPQGQVDR